MIEAAGGLLWRPRGSNGALEVAVVHRPKYDDWTLPKGKLDRGEHPLLGALREVREETGFWATPGRPLGFVHYDKDGEPKRVRYWAMQLSRGQFSAGDEVDELRWLAPKDVSAILSPGRDASVLRTFQADQQPTHAVVLVRHGSAGDRDAWTGEDDARPLDAVGRDQAAGLVALLEAYGVTAAHSAPAQRCVDTVAPYADAAGVSVAMEPLVSEAGQSADPVGAADRVAAIARAAGTPVICTQRGALPGLVVDACRRLGRDGLRLEPVGKGAVVVLHLPCDEAQALVAVEQLPSAPRVPATQPPPRGK